MGQAVLPFLEYLVLQVFVLIVGLNIVRKDEIGASDVLKSWIFGQMILFAVLQIIAVPMILLRCKFDALFWSYCSLSVVLFGFGCWRLVKKKTRIRIKLPELKPLELLLLMTVVLLILWQVCTYFFGIHLDEDDARWLAQANDALEYGDLLTRNFHTGEYTGVFDPVRDVTSPWMMTYGILSKILSTKPAIFAHTIYPPIELFVVYGIYWLIGIELFKKRTTQLSVVLLAILVNMFFTVTAYTQSTFTLIRIWQGKATVAAVIVPMFMYLFICVNMKNKQNTNLWIMIIATGCAACLMSGAGIPLSFVAIFVLGLYSIIAYQQWKRIPIWFASLITPLGCGLLYLLLKG